MVISVNDLADCEGPRRGSPSYISSVDSLKTPSSRWRHHKIDQLREIEVVNLTAAVRELTTMLRAAPFIMMSQNRQQDIDRKS